MKGGPRTALSALGAVYQPARPGAATSPARPAPKPATFAPDPARRAMVAKLHLARKELRLDEDDYRAILQRVTGRTSAAELTAAQLDAALAEMRRLGWQPRPVKGPRPADHPAAKKARAMLISLGLLGVIRNPTEAALEAFARRQMGTERLQWADQAQVYKLIEALKAIAERHGWKQSTAGLTRPVEELKRRLCRAIARRLAAHDALPPQMDVDLDALGIDTMAERDLERLARTLGQQLAAAMARAD